MHTIGELILKSAEWLKKKDVDAPRLDAELLMARVMGCERLKLYMEWQKPLVELEVAAYRDLIRQRGQDRIPIARLLGKKEFYGRDFEVTPAVFVPRPETEGLVERALRLLESEPALRVDRPMVFEIGTGSGCIVVSLAAEDARPHYIATDASADALAVARRNAERNGVDRRVEFRNDSVFGAYEGTLHLVVSNPPYVRSGEIPELAPEVRVHDPHAALDGGADGLDIVRRIVADAKPLLVPGGCILMEIGEEQEAGTLAVFRDAGGYADAVVERDDFGKPRYAFARRA